MTGKPRRPVPRPRPDLVRRPTHGFGWLDQALLHDGWLASIGNDATAVLVLLALAADRHGASFYSRHRMALALGSSLRQVDVALQRLRDCGLVDFLPWRTGSPDGVWQLLPTPLTDQSSSRSRALLGISQILESLGLAPPERSADSRRRHTSPNGGAE